MGEKMLHRGASMIGAAAVVVGVVVGGSVVGAGTASAACMGDGNGGCVVNYEPLFPGSVGEFLMDAHLGTIAFLVDAARLLLVGS